MSIHNVLILVLCFATLAPIASGQTTHRFKPTVGHSTFAARPPVLTVKPGTRLRANLFGASGTSGPAEMARRGWADRHRGAEPGDTLVVHILRVRPNRDTAVSTQGGTFGALVPDSGTAFLNDMFPRGRYVWRLDRERMTGTVDLPGSSMKKITVPLSPMLGRVATAPEGDEAFNGLWPGRFGGNMDTPDVREGTTVYLPVSYKERSSILVTATLCKAMARSVGRGLKPQWKWLFASSW